MSAVPERKSEAPARITRGTLIAGVLAVVVIAGIAYDTKVVRIGSEHDVREQAFSKDAFGTAEFPKVQADVEKRAVKAEELAAAIAADKAAASKKYGVATTTGPVLPVSFTGVVGERKGNMNTIKVAGIPDDVTVRLQTGPAINGTDLRDATGEIVFGQFKNQIEYQDAGSALNLEMKKQALAGIDPETLSGKTIEAVGVFKLINPKNWLVTPVKVKVQ